MTDLTPFAPADDPAEQVLAIPGVAALFPVHVVAHVRETMAVVFASHAEPLTRVEVSTTSGITRIRARIATDGRTSVPETGRAVATALLARADTPDALVTVQIAHIGPPPRR